MVYLWCKKCRSRVCNYANSHRAAKFVVYRADFMLGGRYGDRKRESFATSQDAKDFEHETMAKFRRGEYLPEKGKITFKDLADRYYNDHCLAENHDKHRTTLCRIEKLKSIFGNRLASSITRSEIRELRVKLQAEWEGATINRVIGGVLKPMFNKGIEWDLINTNPCDYLKKVEEKEPIPRFLTKEELSRLYRAIMHENLRDYADVILHSGARPSSIASCSFDSGDVNLTQRIIWFTTYKGRRKHRYAVPVDDVLYEILLRRTITTGGKGLVFDVTDIQRRAKHAVKLSGVNESKNAAQHFSIYGLKHCYASYLLMSGASVLDVAKLLGHTDVKMVVKHYGHLSIEHLRKVQAGINMTPNNVDTLMTPIRGKLTN